MAKRVPSAPVRFLPWLGGLLLAAGVVRIMFLSQHLARLPFLRTPDQDAALYDEWARALVAGIPFGDGPFHMAPGYPYFLSLLYRFLGPDPLGPVIVQSVLGLLILGLTGVLARRLFGPREGILAALLVAGVGATYFYEAKLLAVTLATALSLGAILLALPVLDGEVRGRRAVASSVGAGLVAGILAVVRANLLIVGGVILLVLAWRAARRRLPARAALLYAAGLALALLPTFAHNLSEGVAAPVAVNGGFNFYAGNHRGATGVYVDPPGVSGLIGEQEAELDALVAADVGRPLPPGEENRYWLRRARAEILADPGAWVRLLARKARLLVSRPEETVNGSFALESSVVPLLRWAAVPFNLLAVLGVLGLVLARGGRRVPRGARADLTGAVAVLVAVAATALLFFVMSRFRLPAVPVLAVLSAHALIRGADAVRAGRWLPAAVAGGAVLLFCAGTWASPLGGGRNPEWESGLYAKAAARLRAEGRLEASRAAARDALRLDPGNASVRLLLAEMSLQDGDPDTAVRELQAAVEAEPTDLRLRRNLGILLYRMGRHRECLATMEALVAADSTEAIALQYAGLSRKDLGDLEGGVRDLARALDLDPTLQGSYVGLVEIALRRGDPAAARGWLEAAEARGVPLPAEVRRAVP